jgi:hypothetical protein
MRMVFSKAQVAEALGMTTEEFDAARPELERLSFPSPVLGMVETWSMINVSNWVNREASEEESPAIGTAANECFN